MSPQEKAKTAWNGLTEAQRDVVRLTAVGMQAKEVSRQLGITEAAVRGRLFYAYSKLGIKKATQAAVLCTLAGEITDWKNAA